MIQPVRTRNKSIEHAYGNALFSSNFCFQCLSRERFNQRHWKLDRHTSSLYDITSGIPVAFFHIFFTIKKTHEFPTSRHTPIGSTPTTIKRIPVDVILEYLRCFRWIAAQLPLWLFIIYKYLEIQRIRTFVNHLNISIVRSNRNKTTGSQKRLTSK